jgi:hypothetical protein
MRGAKFFEDGGLIWIDLGPKWPGFTEALNDGVSSLSPRGQASALSTYWIDHALAGAASPPGTMITGGNSTRIERTSSGVCAKADYEQFDDEHLSTGDFLDLLRAWRDEVVALQAERDPDRPEHVPYQRNPFE